MPTFRNNYAHRVRYPNGGHSGPFIVEMSKADMRRVSQRILTGEWPEHVQELRRSLMPAHGVMTAEVSEAFMAARLARDPFDSGSARLSCAYDRRYWQTASVWQRHCYFDGDYKQVGPFRDGASAVPCNDPERLLYRAESTLLLRQGDECGYIALGLLGIEDPNACLARTVLVWSDCIEEWEREEQ